MKKNEKEIRFPFGRLISRVFGNARSADASDDQQCLPEFGVKRIAFFRGPNNFSNIHKCVVPFCPSFQSQDDTFYEHIPSDADQLRCKANARLVKRTSMSTKWKISF